MTEEDQLFFDHADNLLQVYSEVQENVKEIMRSFAESATAFLPEPNL